ncbi:MAG: hypothetical protein EXX96DRAFT_566959 [Benjaminiella poitrasii]|nr:MAG: hypothetical protein EXX96DRAFT_566959 [Benjaminiella poitrasii]
MDNTTATKGSNSSDSDLTLTPCTRLSRMTLYTDPKTEEKQIRLTVSNFNEKLMNLTKEEEKESIKYNHIYDDATGIQIGYSSEYEEEEDIFPPSLLALNLPEQDFSAKSIFAEDEFIDETYSEIDNGVMLITDYEEMEDEFFDPTLNWLSCIYQDDDTQEEYDETMIDVILNDYISNKENKPPANWEQQLFENKPQQQSTLNKEDFTKYRRAPLELLTNENTIDIPYQEELPVKKKMISINNRYYQAKSISRPLTPPRFSTKDKGKEPMKELFML